eukprot:3513205-Amphidinium_carterae.2
MNRTCARDIQTLQYGDDVSDSVRHLTILQGKSCHIVPVRESDADMSIHQVIESVAGPVRFQPLVNGTPILHRLSVTRFWELGVASILLVPLTSVIVTLTDQRRAAWTQTIPVDGGHYLFGPGSWVPTPADGACWWHSVSRHLEMHTWSLRSTVVERMEQQCAFLAETMGSTDIEWRSFAGALRDKPSDWADAKVITAACVLMFLVVYIWDVSSGTLTRVGGFESAFPPLVLKLARAHYQPWCAALAFPDMDVLFAPHVVRVDGRIDVRLVLAGGGGENENKGWRSRAKSRTRDASDEDKDAGRAVNRLRSLKIGIVSRRHLPLLLAVEPSLVVLINTCPDAAKIQLELAKAAKRRDLPCEVAQSEPGSAASGLPASAGQSKPAGDAKIAQWKAPEAKKSAPQPKCYQLVASEWSVLPKETFVPGISQVVMVESLDNLRSLATKRAESKDAIAAVAPFRTTDGGLVPVPIHFCCHCVAGTSKEAEVLPGFLYQLSSVPVKHVASARIIEVADDALPSVVLQAIIPAGLMLDAEWNKIRAGDLQQFRSLVEGAFPVCAAKALIDVFRLSRIGDKAAASLIRVRQDSVQTVLAESGMHSVLFVNPLGDLRATFKVLWLSRDDAQSLDQVREMIEAK